MNIKKLDEDLATLARKMNELASMSYDDVNYDQTEEDLHDLEDEFQDKYGNYLEEALKAVHDEFCPESEVLLPIAYVAKKYNVKKDKKTGTDSYEVPLGEGVLVEVDQYLNLETRLVLAPHPTRIILNVNKSHAEVVWQADQ